MNEPRQMNEFEQQLQHTLRRIDAPESLATFLLRAAEAEDSNRQRDRKSFFAFLKPQPWLTGALAAAVLGLCIFGGVHVHHEREQALADQQFDAAVQATDHALQQTRAQLRRAGIPALE